jgi:hypothetical protein
MKIYKSILYTIVIILTFLVFTNPSMNDFKEYLGEYNEFRANKRVKNYFIFSIYEAKDYGPVRYYGIMKNFYLIGRVK